MVAHGYSNIVEWPPGRKFTYPAVSIVMYNYVPVLVQLICKVMVLLMVIPLSCWTCRLKKTCIMEGASQLASRKFCSFRWKQDYGYSVGKSCLLWYNRVIFVLAMSTENFEGWGYIPPKVVGRRPIPPPPLFTLVVLVSLFFSF